MVQIDVALAGAVGATLAAAARVQLRSEPKLWRNGYLASAVAFTAVFLVPAVLYFLEAWPAWDTMYWWDRPPPSVVPACAALVVVASAFGFAGGHALVRSGKEKAAFALPIALIAPALAVMGIYHDRFLHVGTVESFRAGASPNLLSSDLFWAQVTVIPILVGVPLSVLVARWAGPAIAQWRAGRAARGR
ncbi:MAG: hypothetical protein HYZ28_26445 [Myxococcales bacterium]|nr:hypothetical protein [Myxococcales bacterium]